MRERWIQGATARRQRILVPSLVLARTENVQYLSQIFTNFSISFYVCTPLPFYK
jgi:hypothetical protein